MLPEAMSPIIIGIRKGEILPGPRSSNTWAWSLMGDQPSFLARSLLNGRSRVVGLCLREQPSDPWSGALIQKIQCRLYESGLYLNTIVTPSNGLTLAEQLKREAWALNFFAQIKAGAVLIGPLDMPRFFALSDVLRNHRAVIAFDSLDTLPINHLRLDLAEGCRLAVQLLYENGHRSIGYIGRNWFEESHPSDNTRYALVRQLARHYGMQARAGRRPSAPQLQDSDPGNRHRRSDERRIEPGVE